MTTTLNRFESLPLESESDEDSTQSWRMTEDNKPKYVCPKRNTTRRDAPTYNSYTYHTFQCSKGKNNKNFKKILCKNIIGSNGSYTCTYGTKCEYAHKLEEQTIDHKRKHAYEILENNEDLSNIDLREDHSLYRSLLELSSLCTQCDRNECTGGYNCKFGACMKKYHICQKDLNYGNCSTTCDKIHLSKRGLRSFYSGFVKQSNQNIQGTLLSSDFFRKFEIQENNNDDLDDFSDISDNSSESDQTDECNQSIFQ
jgi:hypothetical protein